MPEPSYIVIPTAHYMQCRCGACGKKLSPHSAGYAWRPFCDLNCAIRCVKSIEELARGDVAPSEVSGPQTEV